MSPVTRPPGNPDVCPQAGTCSQSPVKEHSHKRQKIHSHSPKQKVSEVVDLDTKSQDTDEKGKTEKTGWCGAGTRRFKG